MIFGRGALYQAGISLLLVLYFVVFFWKASEYTVWSKVLKLSPNIWLFLVVYSFLNYSLRAFRWSLLIRQITHDLSYPFLMIVYLFGFLFSSSPGKIGEVFRCYLLSRYSIPYFKSFSIFIFERMSDLAVICCLVLFIFSFEYLVYVLFVVAFLLLLVFLIFNAHLFLPIIKWLTQFLGGVQNQLLKAATFSNLLMALLLGLLAWIMQGFVLFELLLGFGVELPVLTVIGVYALSLLIGALSMMPGGVGAVELSLVVILLGLGVSEETAVTCTLLTRVFTLWLSILVGGVASIIFWFSYGHGQLSSTKPT
jgi:uncharacterized membrane protein YbhN (UPF0104 family)